MLYYDRTDADADDECESARMWSSELAWMDRRVLISKIKIYVIYREKKRQQKKKLRTFQKSGNWEIVLFDNSGKKLSSKDTHDT